MIVILKATVVLATILMCHSVLATYHGYASENCSGDIIRFESWKDLTESVCPKIRSYKWTKDESEIERPGLSNRGFNGKPYRYSAPLSLDEILFEPPDWFFTPKQHGVLIGNGALTMPNQESTTLSSAA